MNEQVFMCIMSSVSTFNFALLLLLWNHMNKKFDKVDEKIDWINKNDESCEVGEKTKNNKLSNTNEQQIRDLDKRLYGIEIMMKVHNCRALRDKHMKKDE